MAVETLNGLKGEENLGTFNRAILLRQYNNKVIADLEDDFHRFRVIVKHDGEKTVSVEGEAHRHPWSICPGAVSTLRLLAGAPLDERCTTLTQHGDIRSNCTHMFDLAGLAIAFARSDEKQKYYMVNVPRGTPLQKRARLFKDNVLALDWLVGKTEIFEPKRYLGVSMKGKFAEWVHDNLDVEEAEMASILRRCIYIGSGHGNTLKTGTRASVHANKVGACHTYTRGNVDNAIWMDGSCVDWTNNAHNLLADVPMLDASGSEKLLKAPPLNHK